MIEIWEYLTAPVSVNWEAVLLRAEWLALGGALGTIVTAVIVSLTSGRKRGGDLYEHVRLSEALRASEREKSRLRASLSLSEAKNEQLVIQVAQLSARKVEREAARVT